MSETGKPYELADAVASLLHFSMASSFGWISPKKEGTDFASVPGSTCRLGYACRETSAPPAGVPSVLIRC
jgi:hypothetical protein